MTTAVIVSLILGVIVWVVLKYLRQEASNRAEGVIAEVRDLRLTRTELIEGHRRSSRRYPLAGMRASVEDSNHRTVYLTVHHDDGTILREISIDERPDIGVDARAFAAQINRSAGGVPPRP